MVQVTAFKDYRIYLKTLLEQRAQQHPPYSLRAFARDLEMQPSRLSEILNRKKGLSLKGAAVISRHLALNLEETEYFSDLVQIAHARSAEERQIASLRVTRTRQSDGYRQLKDDALHIIGEWFHYAILELTVVKGFRSDVPWIASQLRLSPITVKLAIERLLRHGLLAEKNGLLVKADANLTTTNDIPSSAIRKVTRSLLEKAVVALETQSVETRDFSTVTMAVDKDRLPAAKEMITEFRRRLSDFLESGVQQDLYCLSIQLFQLSKLRGEDR